MRNLPMGRDDNLERVLERHRAFWAMEDADAPLLHVGRYRPLQRRPPFLKADGSPAREGDRLYPERVDVLRLVEQVNEPSTVVDGDFIRGRAPYDLCWTESVAGCPVRWKAGHVWSDPFLEHLRDVELLRVSPDNRWLAILLEVTRLLVREAGGRYPISQPLLRGPIDIASAVLGDEALCWAMVDEPDRFRRLLEACTDVFLAVSRTWSAMAPSFRGGYCIYDIWAPGTVVRTQADNAALLSPRMYRDFLLPCDERIGRAFDYPLIHTHSGVLHIMADALLDLENLRAVQVSLDYPAGPPLEEVLPLFRRLHERKALIITGAVTRDELDSLLGSLSPGGLSLQVDLRGA